MKHIKSKMLRALYPLLPLVQKDTKTDQNFGPKPSKACLFWWGALQVHRV